LGCSIDKLITRTSSEARAQIIKEQIAFESAEDVERVLSLFDKDFNFKPAIMGTAVHKLYSTQHEGLVHYKTLELAGIEPKPSGVYTETLFNYKLQVPKPGGLKEIVISIKPDAYLFFKRGSNDYDLVIIDLKTSRVLQYPEQKYLQQTLFYGWVIEQVAAQELGISVQNIYSVLDKSPFYKAYFGEKKIIPHNTFRQQVFAPITVFEPGHQLRQEFPGIVELIVDEKIMLKEDSGAVADYKQRMKHGINACQGCGMVSKMICNYAVRKHKEGENVFGKVSK